MSHGSALPSHTVGGELTSLTVSGLFCFITLEGVFNLLFTVTVTAAVNLTVRAIYDQFVIYLRKRKKRKKNANTGRKL